VTLLSVFSSNAIAVPLSPSFPANELKYILDNSETFMLLASTKFHAKAEEVVKGEPNQSLILGEVEKRLGGNTSADTVELRDVADNQAGMMLYTSGTTSRPVSASRLLKIS
jgi:malonyl-CoA/methylmalonyl-CoA synthetase